MNPLQRLYKTKLALLATIATVVGLVMLMLSHWLSARPGWAWFSGLVNDIGASLFSIGLLGIFFQYIGAADQEQADDERVRRMLKETAPDIRDAVIEGFAFAPDSLTSVASPQVLDRIIENCLAIQLADPRLARDAYLDLREQVMQPHPRMYDTRVTVDLSIQSGARPALSETPFFTATIQWEYKVVPDTSLMRFACVSDLDEYRALLEDPTYAIVCHVRPDDGIDGSSPEAFSLLQVTVDGQPLKARRTTRGQSQTFIVKLDEQILAAEKPVTLSYTYRTLVKRHGHLLHLDISHPSKGLHVQFSYAGCGIRYVNVLDYVAGARQPKISQLPPDDPTPTVDVDFDGWVFPKGGVAFVWVLEGEITKRDSTKKA